MTFCIEGAATSTAPFSNTTLSLFYFVRFLWNRITAATIAKPAQLTFQYVQTYFIYENLAGFRREIRVKLPILISAQARAAYISVRANVLKCIKLRLWIGSMP